MTEVQANFSPLLDFLLCLSLHLSQIRQQILSADRCGIKMDVYCDILSLKAGSLTCKHGRYRVSLCYIVWHFILSGVNLLITFSFLKWWCTLAPGDITAGMCDVRGHIRLETSKQRQQHSTFSQPAVEFVSPLLPSIHCSPCTFSPSGVSQCLWLQRRNATADRL